MLTEESREIVTVRSEGLEQFALITKDKEVFEIL